MSDEIDETTAAALTRALASAPAPRMPDDVWDRLQAALVIEAANRDAADGRGTRDEDPVKGRLAKAWESAEDPSTID